MGAGGGLVFREWPAKVSASAGRCAFHRQSGHRQDCLGKADDRAAAAAALFMANGANVSRLGAPVRQYTGNEVLSGATDDHIKGFLSDLAVKGRVSAATQKQALNSLVLRECGCLRLWNENIPARERPGSGSGFSL